MPQPQGPRRAACRRGAGLIHALLCAGLLTAGGAGAHEGTKHEGESAEPPVVLAPGYQAARFPPPPPGSYRLPALGEAADGDVVTSDGKRHRLADLLRGRLAVLAFVYTHCDDVNGCPLATFVLSQVARKVSADSALASQVRLLSLSFDVARDTPAVLERYAAPFRRAGDDWLFAVPGDNRALAEVLAAYDQSVSTDIDADGNPLGTFSHILRVFLIDAEGRIRNIYSTAFLHADTVLSDLRTLAMAAGDDAPAAATANVPTGPGDVRDGYEHDDYQSRSQALSGRRGVAGDLLAALDPPPLGLPALPVPADNPLGAAGVALGRKLFYDRRLSLNGTISCAMCHIPEQGFTSNEIATAVGFEGRTVKRNAPSLYNAAYLERLFHDAREHSLEQQAWSPLLASNEMANPAIGRVIDLLRDLPDYAGLFEAAFAGRGPGMETVGMALASYERTLLSANSAFDRWHFGADQQALGGEAQAGFALFTGKAGCSACHSIADEHALFTDQQLHNTGIGYARSMRREPASYRVQVAPGTWLEVDAANVSGETPPNDLGRYEITLDPDDRWRYRTPSLRNVALSAPYMHDGSLATLVDVVNFYDNGGVPNPLLDARIRPLDLSEEEKQALVAFLESLTGDNVAAIVSDAFAAPIGDPD